MINKSVHLCRRSLAPMTAPCAVAVALLSAVVMSWLTWERIARARRGAERPSGAVQVAPAGSTDLARRSVSDARGGGLSEEKAVAETANEGLLAQYEGLGREVPRRAWEQACKRAEPPLREQLLEAVLRGWGAIAPDDAAEFALKQQALDPMAAIAAVLIGAAGRPEAAVDLARRLWREDPGRTNDYAAALIHALAGVGEHRLAAEFAATSDDSQRPDWLRMAYIKWGECEPEVAAEAALATGDPSSRIAAFRSAVEGWARKNPREVADTAVRLPDGPEREAALSSALVSWVRDNPSAAASWLEGRPPSLENDLGFQLLASSYQEKGERMSALRWAERIPSAQTRMAVFCDILGGCTTSEYEVARRYIEVTVGFSPEERMQILEFLNTSRARSRH